MQLQFIPARGRKPRAGAAGVNAHHCNLSPRGDGNWMGHSDDKMIRIAIYPREGTETRRHLLRRRLPGLQFIPARGRKLSFSASAAVRKDCNLSPRGDGNKRSFFVFGVPKTLQFIPARGRKPVRGTNSVIGMLVLQFIPARGRKQCCKR